MFEHFPLQFHQPVWLWLLLLIVPVYFMARRSISGMSRGKATAVFAFRVLVIALLAVALAQPVWEQRGEGVTTTIILDRSQSVPLPLKAWSADILKQAAQENRRPEDRVAVITLARDAQIAAMPDTYATVTTGLPLADLEATNLEAGVQLALAISPNDTANRILLVSDGNETIGHVLRAAELAKANRVPIDVLLLEYEHDREVIFEQLVAPSRARVSDTADLRMVLRSQSPTTGTVTLRLVSGQIDQPLDLNGDEPGTGLRVELEGGSATVIPLDFEFQHTGPHRFEAHFEPDDPAADAIVKNNEAVAVTFVGGEGRVLVIDDSDLESQYLVQALRESGMNVDVMRPGGLVGGHEMLVGYDAIVLANVPRHAFDDFQDRMLRAYVHDLGGGLVMLGGPQSFGAGGWIDSAVAEALPVEMNPPQSRQMPRGALALIMHSCEMPQGNFWGQKVAEAAIKALSSLDYAGLIVFDWGQGGGVGGISGCTWAFPMQVVGDKAAALAATKQMTVGDMPDFQPGMQVALNGLTNVNAGQKHCIVISDGDPSPPSQQLLNNFVAAGVTISTVMVGGHGTPIDRSRMQAVAETTGGTFYNVTNPKNLPAIFIKEAQLVSRSLIQESDTYQPHVVSRLPGPAQGYEAVPAVEGYVLTAPRQGLAQTPIVISTTEGDDPVYAHWNYGLGKGIAYTSDITGRWGERWTSWAQFRAFWEQSIRWVMRPSAPEHLPGAAVNVTLNTRLEGDRAIVEMEALGADQSFLNLMQTNAVLLDPDGEPTPLSMQQTGPGKYRAEFEVDDAGAYLVSVKYGTGAGGNAREGYVHAAVTVPYADEYRATKHNAALLRDLADSTKGRMLAVGDPALTNLFDDTALEPPVSPTDVWDLLTILAAALFVMDVAARRLSIDPATVAALFGRAVDRRRETSTGAMDAFKRTRQAVSERSRTAPDETPPAKSTRFEASEQDTATALDVSAETSGEGRGSRDTPAGPKHTDDAPATGAEDGDGDYTSRLLKAKRRARGEEQDGS